MQFQRKTRAGGISNLMKIFIKISFVFIILLLTIVLIDKINFPSPQSETKEDVTNQIIKLK